LIVIPSKRNVATHTYSSSIRRGDAQDAQQALADVLLSPFFLFVKGWKENFVSLDRGAVRLVIDVDRNKVVVFPLTK